MSKEIEEIKSYLAKDDVKRIVQDEYINMILRLHPDVKKSSVIEHLNLVALSGANPHKKQVYFTSYFSKKLGYAVGTTVFSYRFFEDVANQTGEFLGCDCNVMVDEYFNPLIGEFNKTLKAVAIAKRQNRDDVTFTAWYPEFVQKNYKGEVNNMWSEKPHTMLRKCAIAGALRSQFPETLGSFLIEDEITQSDYDRIEHSQSIDAEYEHVKEKEKKHNENLERALTSKTKEPLIEEVNKKINLITSGMDIEQKIKWITLNLKIDSTARLKDFKVDDLKSMLNELIKLEKEPIIM